MYGHTPVGGVLGAAAVGGTLPFTGLSLVWWVLVGAMLLVLGAALLRLSHAVGRMRARDLPDCEPR